MGDVVMTTPALRALKESFGAHITLLTSSMAHRIAPFIPFIDKVMVADLPWVKAGSSLDAEGIQALTAKIKAAHFDAAVIFTVYSQSALPAAMLAMLAGIPQRLAYCRENPYTLLTDWVPDEEPYRFIKHQVERDLMLVNSVGAVTLNNRLAVDVQGSSRTTARSKLAAAGIAWPERFIIFHPGVSEVKRRYPVEHWIEVAELVMERGNTILITGTAAEWELAQTICDVATQAGQATNAAGSIYNIAGLLEVGEFIALIDAAAVVVSVNTATVHIAAARQTPVVVLYALTNPQHTPWQVPCKILTFSIPQYIRSKNEIVSYVHDTMFKQQTNVPLPVEVVAAATALMTNALKVSNNG
jgi:ADP-heptose:LPS heptosyltransferase